MKQAILFVLISLMLCACNRNDAACEAEKQTEERNKQLEKDVIQMPCRTQSCERKLQFL